MSLGRSSRFCFLGLAKVKSEKVLSSFASASSITIHHGSTTWYQDPWHRCWQDLDEYGSAQVLESTHKRQVLSSALTGIALSFLGYAITFQTVDSLSTVELLPSYENHSLCCLQQGNPHHPSPSMPFYRPPPNDRSRIALGWFKEFQ